MFQESALFPWLTVEKNVRFGMKIAGLSKDEQDKRLEKYLKMVQLYLDCKILLMDEPFAALDKQTINVLREELLNIWQQTKKTIILVTHSVEEALFFSDRIVMIGSNPGRVKDIIKIDIPRPRHIDSLEFVNIRKKLLDTLKEEVDKIEKEEHDS